MKCVNVGCGRSIPDQVLYCPHCGNRSTVQLEYSSYVNYLGVHRTTSMDLYAHGFNPMQISLASREGTHANELPGLCGYEDIFTAPDNQSDKFNIYKASQRTSESSTDKYLLAGQSDAVLGGIGKASTPIFDGLFFNVVAANRIYRFGITRSGKVVQHSNQYTHQTVDTRIEQPLLIRKKTTIMLLFISGNKVFALDISKWKEEAIGSISVPALPHNDSWGPLIHFEGSNVIFLKSKQGVLYEVALPGRADKWTTTPQLISNTTSQITSLPIAIGRDMIFIGQNKNKAEELTFYDYHLTAKNFSSKKIQLKDNSYQLNDKLVYSENKIYIFNEFSKNEAVSIDKSGSPAEVNFPHGVEASRFFIIDNMLYTLHNQKLIRYRLNNIRSAEQPEAFNQHRNVGSLTGLHYINGFAAVQTTDQILFKSI